MRKVLAVTGIRSEYYILRPVLLSISEDPDFRLEVVVSGSHLSQWHGETMKDIERDGFDIVDRIDSLFMTNRDTQRVKGLGVLLYGLSQVVERTRPDFLLVVGDREEAIATALVGNYMKVLTAHIGGGDTAFSNADDPVRFATSKLAHIHFTTAKQYADNLMKVGEESFRIFFVGNPALDGIRKMKELSWDEVKDRLSWQEIDSGNYIVFLKHPVSSSVEDSYFQVRLSLEVVLEFAKERNMKVIGIYPNTDPGSFDILKAINEVCRGREDLVRFYRNLEQDVFVNVMRGARALVGNSSMGILEAPFYKLGVVNIGDRQKGRLNAGNVVFVGYDKEEIYSALEKVCFDDEFRRFILDEMENPYGDGYASERILEVLKGIDPKDKRWLVKEVFV